MPEINPYLKALLRLLELAGVALLIYLLSDFLADLFADPEVMVPTGGDLADMNLLSPLVIMLGFFVFLLYFLFWHFRILGVIFKEKQRKIKRVNIALILLLPAIFAAGYGYHSFKNYLEKHEREKVIVPVAYQTVFQTPHRIIGRLVNDSLFVFTRKAEALDPDKKNKSADEAINGLQAERKQLYGSEELYILHEGNLKKADLSRRNLNPNDLYFQRYDECLIPLNPSQSREVHRYNHCYDKKIEKPALSGFSADFRSRDFSYQVNNELFFVTRPLHPAKEDKNKLFIGHITDASARVYTLDLSKDERLAQEFTGYNAYFNLFATAHTVYLISNNRVLAVKL